MNEYTSHSHMTNPGQFRHLYDGLPADLDGLHHVINNIFIHMWKLRKSNIGTERKSDYAIRNTEAILKRITAYDDAPLTRQRPRHKQFVGDCRHAAVLLCSMLRQQGIPARVRHGFCQYISSDTNNYSYHVVTEFWDGQRWVLEDADIIRHDIPREEFIFGAQAWQKYRAGEINLERFYLTEDLFGEAWIFPLPMLRDLASLANYEVTSSDSWGLISPYHVMSDTERAMLDDAASILSQDGDTFNTVQDIYQKYPLVRVSRPLFAWEWAVEDMIEFDISAELK